MLDPFHATGDRSRTHRRRGDRGHRTLDQRFDRDSGRGLRRATADANLQLRKSSLGLFRAAQERGSAACHLLRVAHEREGAAPVVVGREPNVSLCARGIGDRRAVEEHTACVERAKFDTNIN